MANKDFTNELLRLFESEDGAMFVAKDKPKRATADDRLVEAFQEIVEFGTAHARNPVNNTDDFSESLLAKRLEAIKNTPKKVLALVEYDFLGLLVQPEAPKSMEELLENDEFGIFS
ncbi:MAG: GIY-YIG nuclease family protein, partial [Patescibacteria group bacterium]